MAEEKKAQTDEELIISKITNRKQYYETRYAKSLEDADKENAYFRSEQYTAEEIEAVTDEDGNVTKPLITLNHIKPHINFLRGEQSVNRYFFKVIPGENVAPDETVEYDGQQITVGQVAEQLTEELKKAENENDGEYEISDCFLEGISGGGRSYLEVFVKEDESVFPYVKQTVFEHRGQKRCFADPDHTKYDLSDSKDFIKMTEYSKDDLKSMFEGKDSIIDGLTREEEELFKKGVNDDNELNYNDNTPKTINDSLAETQDDNLILVEYYDYKWLEEFMLVTNTGEPPTKISKEDSKKVREMNEQRAQVSSADLAVDPLDELGQPKQKFEFGMFKLKRKEWYINSYVSSVLLERVKLEVNGVAITRLPFAEYGADVAKYIDEISQRYISATKDMISPQDLHNKGFSAATEHLVKSINSGIVAEENTLVDEDHWEEFGSSPGFLGKIKKGQFDKWKQIFPQPLSQGHSYFAQAGAEEMRYITNINLQSRGQSEKEASGRAKAIDVRQAERGTHFYYDNLRRTKHVTCKIMLEFICALKGCDPKKLKIVIDDAAEGPTTRYENQAEINSMLESGALDSPYADLIIDNMNFNNREEWKARWGKVNEFAQFKQEQERKAQAEKMAIEDSRKDGLLPPEGQTQ